MKTCQISEKYPLEKCRRSALDDGFCILHSDKIDKNKDEFYNLIKKRLSTLDYNFSGIFFPDSIKLFEKLRFDKPVNFRYARFNKIVSFSRCEFEEADFSGVIFSDTADFQVANFKGGANFSFAEFIGGAIFSLSQFEGETEFTCTDFYEMADFSDTKFYRYVIFDLINSPHEGKKPIFVADFSDIHFAHNAILLFKDLSLEFVIFNNTDLRKIDFKNITWCHYRGRELILDELLFYKPNIRDMYEKRYRLIEEQHVELSIEREIEKGSIKSDSDNSSVHKNNLFDYASVEELYRYLKLNYESAGNYKRAGDFHYGEMEMHRRGSKWRWFPFYWYNLYRWLSGYGERPSWALGWLAGFLLALPLLVWGFGLDRVTGGTTPGFLETLAYIFEKATFQRPPQLSNLNFLGTFISNLSLLIIPGQAALFLLALRNRLGRRR